MPKPWIMLLAVAGLASAQRSELGALAGAGGFTASGPTIMTWRVGAEACLLCAGRFGIFGEYGHWFSGSSSSLFNPSDQVRRADMVGGGLRIQGRGSVRPFFDVGIAGGRDEHRAGSGGALVGVVVGGGVRFPFHEHWYIRPQIRAYGLSPHTLEGVNAHWALSGAVGIGYSW